MAIHPGRRREAEREYADRVEAARERDLGGDIDFTEILDVQRSLREWSTDWPIDILVAAAFAKMKRLENRIAHLEEQLEQEEK